LLLQVVVCLQSTENVQMWLLSTLGIHMSCLPLLLLLLLQLLFS
jgi:hypothetical protein